MKYKKIPKDYIKICLDRLTRLKPVSEKYERVFIDILNKFLIAESKKTTSEKKITIDDICNNACEIFNASIPANKNATNVDNYIQDILLKEAEINFNLSNDDFKFLNTKLNLTAAIQYISDENFLPLNLKRLVLLEKNRKKDAAEIRKKYSLLYPITKIILTEGATEEILLSKFADKLGYNFYQEGVFVLAAGGKNQVAKKYYKMIEGIKLPIFILLDSDAEETRELILPKLRNKDKIHLIKTGEFEDILTLDLIIRAINFNFSNNLHCSINDFEPETKMTKNLHRLFKKKGFGEYQKAEFAKMIANYLQNNKIDDIGLEIQEIINEVKNF